MIGHATDSGRQRLMNRRDLIEHLLALAEHLDERDRLLLEQIYKHGLSAAQVASLTGQPTRRLQRHVRRLLKRLDDPLFRFTVARLDLLPPDTRPVARAVFLHGLSLRETAHRTGLSLHRVRRHAETVRTIARMS